MRHLIAIRDFTVNELFGRVPFVGMRTWLYGLMGVKFENRRTTTLMMYNEWMAPGGVAIGRGTIIGRHCILDGRAPLKIGANVNIGGRCQLFTGMHDPHDNDFVAEFKPIVIEDHVWLAVSVIVLPGVTIGRGAVVAAGSVVTRDLPGGKIYAGIPAREIGERRSDLSYENTYRPNGI